MNTKFQLITFFSKSFRLKYIMQLLLTTQCLNPVTLPEKEQPAAPSKVCRLDTVSQ